ncbi:MAG TPA: glycosyltransferase N-terminal domain-containing protein [Candidatus Kryptonia bacterium]|nr:glycosyltransferase N-terminal domain-containing protein [Candidatus Kryptonia bacterium]
MTQSISMLLYDGLGTLAGILAVPVLPVVALTRQGGGLAERLGVLPPAVAALAKLRPIWIHAASVGEVLAAAPLVEALRARPSAPPILLTATSLTGREAARAMSGVAAVMLLPIDVRWIVRHVVRAMAPSALIIMETEIWPALLHAAAAAGVPVAVVSGRVSERAAQRYALVRPIVRAALGCVSAFAMQTESDARRVRELGAPGERVSVTGSLKYARLVPMARRAESSSFAGVDGRPLLIAASMQPGEEAVVLDACGGLWASHPECLLILAPRRPERFQEVDDLLAHRGVRRERRSQLEGAIAPGTQVVLLDSVGELPSLLASARSVFVGGTIAALGGHNVLEPAAAGAAVCFGPHTENVAEAAAALVEHGGGVCVRTADELLAVWRRAVAEPQTARAMGTRAREVVEARAAVLPQTMAALAAVLS